MTKKFNNYFLNDEVEKKTITFKLVKLLCIPILYVSYLRLLKKNKGTISWQKNETNLDKNLVTGVFYLINSLFRQLTQNLTNNLS